MNNKFKDFITKRVPLISPEELQEINKIFEERQFKKGEKLKEASAKTHCFYSRYYTYPNEQN